MKNTVWREMEPHLEEAYSKLFASEEAFWEFMHLTTLAFRAEPSLQHRFLWMLEEKKRGG